MNDRPIIKESIEDYKTQLLITHRAFDKQKDIIKGQINTLQREELIKAPTSSALQNEIDALFKLFLDTQIVAEKLVAKITDEEDE